MVLRRTERLSREAHITVPGVFRMEQGSLYNYMNRRWGLGEFDCALWVPLLVSAFVGN
jgi:hypothetical protein